MSSPVPEASTSRPVNLTIDTSPSASSSLSTTQGCRWNWCREVFPNHVELAEHVLSTHANATPIKRKDLVLEYKAHGRTLDPESTLRTPSHSALDILNPVVKLEDAPPFSLEGTTSFQTPRRATSQAVRARTRTPAPQTPSRYGTPTNRQTPFLRSPAPGIGITRRSRPPTTPIRASAASQIAMSLSGQGGSTPIGASSRNPGHAHVHTHSQIRFRALTEASSPAQTPESAKGPFPPSPSTAELIANIINNNRAAQVRQQHNQHQHLHHHHYEILQHHPPLPSAGASQEAADGYSGNHGLDPALTLKTPVRRKQTPTVTVKVEEQTGMDLSGSTGDDLQSAQVERSSVLSHASQNGESSRMGNRPPDVTANLPPREFRRGSLTLHSPLDASQRVPRISTGSSKQKHKMKAETQEETNPISGLTTNILLDENASQAMTNGGVIIPETSQNQPLSEPFPQDEQQQHNSMDFSQEPSSIPSQIGPPLEQSQWAVPLMTQAPYDYDYPMTSSSETHTWI